MLKHSLAALALVTSLAACGDRAAHIIQVPPQEAVVDRPGSMTVNGQATIEVSPDCADLTITIGSDHPNPGTAVKALEAKKLALIAALQKIGIETGQVKLSNLDLHPIYAQTRDGWSSQVRVTTYRSQITITATTKDFAKLGDMMEAAAVAGATSMSSAFRGEGQGTADRRRARHQARPYRVGRRECRRLYVVVTVLSERSVVAGQRGPDWRLAAAADARRVDLVRAAEADVDLRRACRQSSLLRFMKYSRPTTRTPAMPQNPK
jgi:uncharacterized protein YggE